MKKEIYEEIYGDLDCSSCYPENCDECKIRYLEDTLLRRMGENRSRIEWLKREIRGIPPELSRKQLDIQLAHIFPLVFND